MMTFHLSLKHKLYTVITLALIGFSLLLVLSINVLNTLDDASSRVDSISQNANLLKDLQINVLQINQETEGELRHLPEKYRQPLNDLQQKSAAKQATTVAEIQRSLKTFIESRLLWLQASKQIGASAELGLRAEMATELTALEGELFANFRKPFAQLKQTFIAFMDQRGEAEYQQVKIALVGFKSLMFDMEFEDVYGDKITDIEGLLTTLAQEVFSMNKEANNAENAYSTLAKGVDASNSYLANQLRLAKQAATSASEQAQVLILGVGIAVALLVVGLLIGTSRNLVNSLDKMTHLLHQLSEGDLTQKLTVNQARSNELDKVGMAVNEMTGSLNHVLNSVTLTSESLDKGASDLSKKLVIMVENNRTTNNQADSVAAATEEISTTIQHMVSATDMAHQKTQLAQESADQGGEVITSAIDSLSQLANVFDQLNHQVAELDGAYRKVDGVTEMINGLAEQTNLLALNAAIEAARAGDAGRGFSVVADEVRSLAEKTVQATQNINDIIGAMHTSIQSLLKVMQVGSEHVDSGKQLGDKAANAVGQIKTLVLDVNQRNQELAISIDEASKATQVIAENMDQVAHSVSQNREQSQDVLEYVGDVSAQAKELLAMTHKFKCE